MPPDHNCKGTRDDGTPCGAPSNLVDPETGRCPAHQEGARERLREAARKGGEATARRLQGKALDPEELPPLESAGAAEAWCDVVGRAAVTGRIGHNEAKAALRAVREWRESRKSGEVSERLERLLDALEEWRKTGKEEPVLELVETET